MQPCTNFVHRLGLNSLFRPNFLICCKHATADVAHAQRNPEAQFGAVAYANSSD